MEVLTLGRISVDVYPLQVGVSLREVETFSKDAEMRAGAS